MPCLLESPHHLAPEGRRREIAAILAKGVLRLRHVAQLQPDSPKNPLKPGQEALEVSTTSSPHATRG